MNQYGKVILAIVGFAVLIGGSFFLYNWLADGYNQGGLVEMQVTDEKGVIDSAAEETSEESAENNNTDMESANTEDAAMEEDTAKAEDAATEEAQMAMDFTVINEEGEEVTLSSMFGKPIVLNFWASWCPPCIGEMPEFQSVYAESGEDIKFVMVNMTDGSRETLETAKAFLEEQGYTFPVYYDTSQSAAYAYYVTSIPSTYFIDEEGRLIAGVKGAIDKDTLLQGISMIQ